MYECETRTNIEDTLVPGIHTYECEYIIVRLQKCGYLRALGNFLGTPGTHGKLKRPRVCQSDAKPNNSLC